MANVVLVNSIKGGIMDVLTLESDSFAPSSFAGLELIEGIPLELDLQELEALDAPGWGTWLGRGAAAATVVGTVYGGVALGVALTIIST